MKAGIKVALLTRIGWSLVVGLGLTVVLSLAFALHPAAGARPASPDEVYVSAPVPADDHGLSADAAARSSALLATNSFTEPYVLLEKNEDYYDSSSVAITQVTGLYIDEDEAWTRYKSGQLDDIVFPVSALNEITSGSVYSTHLHTYARQCTYYYGFSNDVSPFDDPLVRAAFASAIDRQQIISDVLNGDELEALTFVPPGSFGHVDGYTKGVGRPYSPTLAANLLAASGYTGTPPITLMYNSGSTHQAIAQAVRQMWIDTLGITVTLQDKEWNSYLDLLNNGTASERPGVWRLGWCGDYPDAHNWHADAMLSNNWPRYNNPSYDAIVDAAASEPVSATRLGQYEQAEAYLVMTDTAIVPIYYFVNRNLTRPDLTRTYRSLGGQHVDEWSSGAPHPLEVAWGAPRALDPALAFDTYVEQLFLGLTDFDEQGNPTPELATAWAASPDMTVYTFTMRSGVTWTNSISTVTAYDVEYGVLRSLDPNTGSGRAYLLYIIENAADYNQGNITDTNQVGVKALDATHIRFTLAGPSAFFPVIAGLPPARPVPRWAIEAHGDAWTEPGNIAANGPYRLAAWEQAPHLRVEKRTDSGDPLSGSEFVFTIAYWNDGGASAEGVVITDTMLGGLTYISDTAPFTHTGSGAAADPIVWYLGAQPAHSSGQFDVRVQVTASASDTITNTAQIATANPYDQGDSWEKESQWVGHVEGPRMRVDYASDFVGGIYPAGHTLWITVTDSASAVKATATVNSEPDGAGHGYWGYDGFVTQGSDWSPSHPDIQPDDLVHFQSDAGYTNTMQIGTISGELDAYADTVSGTISAPWFANQTLQGYAGGWGTPGWAEFTVDLDGAGEGNYFAHFSDDLEFGSSIDVEYVEPDGDKVINLVSPLDLVLNVNYGHDWVQGDYETGHTVWITVTESDQSTVKGTAVLTTGVVPGWGGRTGFSTNWQGWSGGGQPDIVAGDWVYGLADTGYTSTVRMGAINGELDIDADTISGTIDANWFTQTLDANCGVWEDGGPHRQFTVDPNGGSYFCDFSSEWDLLPGQDVYVQYQEPDGDWVYNVFREVKWKVRVNQSHRWVDGEAMPGSTIVATVWRDGLPIVAQTTDTGGGTDWNINFDQDDDFQLQVGDVVDVQTSQGLTASVEIIPMTGKVDANDDTISGQVSGVSNADVRGEVWTNNGAEKDGQTDGSGNYMIDFDSFDVLPGHMVALWYVQPDGHQVGIVRHALRLDVNTMRDEVGGETWPNVPVTVTINGGETATAFSDADGYFDTDFAADIAAGDTVEAWAGTGTQYASLVVETITAYVDDAQDKVWGYGPPSDGSRDNVNVGLDGDWRWTSTDSTGYYEVQYGYDITPNDDLEVDYEYPQGHKARYGFGRSDVSVGKEAKPWNVSPGDELSFFISYSNNASGPATDVIITDTLPYSMTYLWDTSGVSPTLDPLNNTVTWRLGGLGAQCSGEFEMRVEVDAAAPMYTNLRNEVEISDPDDRDPGNNHSDTDVNIQDPQADLWVEKSFGPSLETGAPLAGEVITYNIRYGNNGNRTSSNVLLTDTLPISVSVMGTTFEPGVDGLTETVGANFVVWDIGSLDPGESREFELALQIDPAAAPGLLLYNEIVVAGDDDFGEQRDNWYRYTVMVEPEAADIIVDKEMEGDFSAIENEFVYRILFRNNGAIDAQSVILTDTLPVSMTHLWHSAGAAATVSDGVIVWDLGMAPPGAGGTLLVGVEVSGTVPTGAAFTNTVEAATVSTELDYDNNVAQDVLGPPRAICVPWIGSRPHRTWAGLNTTLKGTAKGYGLTTFEWDPGDGSPIISGSIGDPYAIEASHTYTGSVGAVYVAQLTVYGAFGWSDTDTYTVQIFSPIQGVMRDVAIDDGLWYLHKETNRYRSGGLPFADWQTGGYGVAETASAIQAFQVQGHRPGGDPWEDPYVEDVQRGWNTLFTHSVVDPMTVQSAGDPDGDGDGVGVGIYVDYNHSIYEAGLAMMALASTGSPNRVAHTGPPIYVRGQTYYSITQDMADWFAWGQNDSGWARGGWRYQPNSGDSDNSNTQFPVLGLIAAEENWGIAVPPWVKTELRDYWLAYTQNSEGAFGYMDPNSMPNVAKTGAGIMNLAWTGVPISDTRIVSASNYIETHWNDPIDMNNQGGNVGDYYAMYAVKKGSQVAGIHYYGPYLWDYEYASYLLGVQAPDGSFYEDPSLGLYFHNWQPMATSWALMILSPGLYRPLPVPVVSPIHYGGIGAAWNDGKVRFDASLSHHTDSDREIVLYEWDFGDGNVMTSTNPIVTHTYGARDIYIAVLTVWDDLNNGAARATQVNITAPDTPPVADAGGPYEADYGQLVVLDGSGSYDPDAALGDEVALYEWDLGDGGVYTSATPTLAHTWYSSGLFTVALKVRDRGAEFGLDSPRWSEPATATVTINPPADLWLVKSDDPDPVVVNETLTYTLSVFNHGPAAATNVILTDTLPASVSYDSVTPGAFTCGPAGGGGVSVVVCNLASLAALDTATVTLRVTPSVTGTIFNFAEVTAVEVDPDLTSNSALEATVVTEAPVLDPIVSSVTPDSGYNDAATSIAIAGANFQPGATASLNGTSLSPTVVNDNLMRATVPSGMTPGSYDLTVVNPDGHSGVLLGAFTVLTRTPPAIASVTPAQGPNDTPVTIDIYGSSFAPGLTVTLNLSHTQVPIEGVLFVDGSHLRGVVPIYAEPGVYTITVANPDGLSGALPNAYQVIEASVSDDLYANRSDFWLRPATVREGALPPNLGLTVRRQGGQGDLTNVEVSFYQGDPEAGGALIGTGATPPLPANGAVTTTVSWAPLPPAGTYALYAVIDPTDAVAEDSETNNVISRTVTVLPPLPDTVPPVADSFSINGGAASTSDRQVYLSVSAHDDGGSGVAGVLYIEYEYVQSVADWVPVAESGWLPYASANASYPWLLQPGPGVRYLQAWVADGSGNISLRPKSQLINYTPPAAYVAQGQVHIYRVRLNAGESMRVRLTMSSGDADLYVWAPDGSRVGYSWANNPEIIDFTASASGVYQIEVEGWTGAYYRLEIIPLSAVQMRVEETRVMGIMSILWPARAGRGQPFVMPGDTPTEDDTGLPSAPVTHYLIYMPLVMRQQ